MSALGIAVILWSVCGVIVTVAVVILVFKWDKKGW